MIEGKPAVFISYSEGYKDSVAVPFREFVDSLDLHGVLVGEEPLPEGAENWDPEKKVAWYIDHSVMFVALATADDPLKSGQVHTRQNIIDEIRAARERPHLRNRMQIFRSPDVELPSNINPAYDRLEPGNIEALFRLFENQARAFGVLAPEGPQKNPEASLDESLSAIHAPPSTGAGSDSANAEIRAALVDLESTIHDSTATTNSTSLARIHLATSAELASIETADLFGVHELNGLFRRRNQVQLRASEKRHLLRTMLANLAHENAPGWFWFQDDLPPKLVVDLATEDSDDSVRSACLRLLANCDWPLKSAALRRPIERSLEEEQQETELGLELLAKQGDSSLLGKLKQSLSASSNQEAVLAARVTLQATTSPSSALAIVLREPSVLTDAALDGLVGASRQLPLKHLQLALESSAPKLRLLALRCLDSLSKLTKGEVLPIALGDPASEVRLKALELALKRNWKIQEEDFEKAVDEPDWFFDRKGALRLAFYRRWTRAELDNSVAWDTVRSWPIYQALSELHFDSFGERVRADLREDFSSLKLEADTRLRIELEKLVEDGIAAEIADGKRTHPFTSDRLHQEVEHFFQKLRGKEKQSTKEFVLRMFQSSALEGLCQHGNASDLDIARAFLAREDRDLRSLAIRLLGRIGKPEDADRLTALALEDDVRGEIKESAAKTALELSDDFQATARVFLEDSNSEVVAHSLNALADAQLDQDTLSLIFALLQAPDQRLRAHGIDHLIGRFASSQLPKLIDAYSRGRYFYNVVCRVDRALYAPRWIRSALPG